MQETTFYDDHPFNWTSNYTPVSWTPPSPLLWRLSYKEYLPMPWSWILGVEQAV